MSASIIPVTLPPELHADIRAATKETALTQAEVMRQSIRFGLPKLRAAFAGAASTSKPARGCARSRKP